MGLFDRLFGKNPSPIVPEPTDEDADLQPTVAPPIEGPPELIRAVDMQRAYWTPDAAALTKLEAHGVDELGWPDRLRVHHLLCLERTKPGPKPADLADRCGAIARRLIAADSPFRPRPAMIWQGPPAQPGAAREPDLQGDFLNPSLTHLGCLEVYRLDASNQPVRIDFVSFDELTGVVFGPQGLIRMAKLFFEGGRDEVVLVPLLYGTTWAIGNEYDRAGRMTRFVAHLNGVELGDLGVSGIGVGQQDFSVRKPAEGSRLFGIGSVSEVCFPLDMRDPRFDEKARERGIDPEEVRRRMT